MGKISSTIIIFILFIATSTAYAQFKPASDIDTLAELKGVFFIITGADLFNKNDISLIEKKIARQVGKAGIKVLPKNEYERLARSQTYPLARLELSIETIGETTGAGGQKAYIVSIRAFQLIRLLRKPSIRTWASTWEEMDFVQGKDINAIESSVIELSNRFIKAFKTVNTN